MTASLATTTDLLNQRLEDIRAKATTDFKGAVADLEKLSAPLASEVRYRQLVQAAKVGGMVMGAGILVASLGLPMAGLAFAGGFVGMAVSLGSLMYLIDPGRTPRRTAFLESKQEFTSTVRALQSAAQQQPPADCKAFMKLCRRIGFKGVAQDLAADQRQKAAQEAMLRQFTAVLPIQAAPALTMQVLPPLSTPTEMPVAVEAPMVTSRKNMPL